MSKTLSAALKAHLEAESTTLATCLKLTTKLSPVIVLGFTSHDADIVYDGVTYSAYTGQTPSEVMAQNGVSVGSLDILGVVDATGIGEADLYAGVFDDAELELFIVNFMDLTMGKMILRTGNVGDVRLLRTAYVAEFRDLNQRLQQTIGELYSYTCRATLGDSRCQVALGPFTDTLTVTAFTGQTYFEAADARVDGWFNYGLITWLTGANAGRMSEVVTHETGKFTLMYATPYAIAIGDTCSAVAGCDKQPSTCKDRFSNFDNFRGEPNIVGIDELYANPPIVSEKL